MENNKIEETYEMSESITKIAVALMEFQSKVGLVKKNVENDFFKSKYADLGSIIETIQKPLAEAKLSYVQMPTGKSTLITILMHESGEFFKTKIEMTPKDNSIQAMGSAITYYRRYCLSAILGIATEEDDDGNAASGPSNKKPAAAAPAKPGAKAPAKPAAAAPTGDQLFEKAKKNLEANTDRVQLEDFKVKITASTKYNKEQKAELLKVIDAQIAKSK